MPTNRKKLAEILAPIGETRFLRGGPDTTVDALYYDSRECSPGSVFFAIKGFNFDGHDFLHEAVARGAAALIVERDVKAPGDAAVVLVPDSRRAMGLISAAWFDFPSRKLKLMGVTGTNGKTSVALLTETLMRALGRKTGLIGTIENRIVDEALPVKRTTPESLDLQALLARMVDAGCDEVAMEVSSHAIELNRIAGADFSTGIFTNLTQDHLDFHGDLDSYREAKRKFFTRYLTREGACAIINADDPAAARMAEGAPCRIVRCAVRDTAAEVAAVDVVCSSGGIEYTVAINGEKTVRVKSGLLGGFNVYNTLAVVAFAYSRGLPLDAVARTLEKVPPVPGRFERVNEGQDFTVVVDYAHTPDGLENILRSAGETAEGRVISVFGAGGDRDKTKRPVMGAIAVRLSDSVYVTSDNPRTESPDAIIGDIMKGLESEKNKRASAIEVEPDRFEAIRDAIESAHKGDIVVIAGKGHETYQIFKDRTIHFDDREVARNILRERRNG